MVVGIVTIEVTTVGTILETTSVTTVGITFVTSCVAGAAVPDAASAAFDPACPAFDPESPVVDSESPVFDPASPVFNPASPVFDPELPVFDSSSSPAFDPLLPAFSPLVGPAVAEALLEIVGPTVAFTLSDELVSDAEEALALPVTEFDALAVELLRAVGPAASSNCFCFDLVVVIGASVLIFNTFAGCVERSIVSVDSVGAAACLSSSSLDLLFSEDGFSDGDLVVVALSSVLGDGEVLTEVAAVVVAFSLH